mmetsp:Transcript_1203/g.3355  ORF Transcript_1203/g.3355 Transcript_1203/m.3355 type:complete len:220 (-) Transcript_1203:693-1352(-)
MANVLCSNQREEDIVVLGTLVLIHCFNRPWRTKQRIVCAPSVHNIAKECFLPVVRRQHCNALGRIPKESHVHEHSNNVLCFTKILKEVQFRTVLTSAFKVLHVDSLEVVPKSSVGIDKLGILDGVFKVTQTFVLPLVQCAQGRSRTTLCIKLHLRHTKADETSEEALFHVRELLERHVLDDRRKLVVISNESYPLESVAAILWVLQKQWNKCFDLKNLC